MAHEFLYDGKLPEWIANTPDLQEAMRLAGGGRPEYLTSLYRYCTMLPDHATVVEVGCNLGESSIVMAHALKHKLGRIITIDPVFITGTLDSPDSLSPTGNNIYNSTLVEYGNKLRVNRIEPYVTVIPDYSANAIARWDGYPIDMLFVDGEHTYKAVSQDCEWMRYVKVGGFAVFDDYWAEIVDAVQDYLSRHSGWRMVREPISGYQNNQFAPVFQKIS